METRVAMCPFVLCDSLYGRGNIWAKGEAVAFQWVSAPQSVFSSWFCYSESSLYLFKFQSPSCVPILPTPRLYSHD